MRSSRLKRRYVLAPVSNGNISLMVDLARKNGFPWDAILGAEVAGDYKPKPRVYLAAAEALDLPPQQCMMVAAHSSLTSRRRPNAACEPPMWRVPTNTGRGRASARRPCRSTTWRRNLGDLASQLEVQQHRQDGAPGLLRRDPGPAGHLVAEPGELPLHVAPRVRLPARDGLLQRRLAIEMGEEPGHAVRAHDRQRRVEAARRERLHLLQRALLHHGAEAVVDPLSKRRRAPGRGRTARSRLPTGGRRPCGPGTRRAAGRWRRRIPARGERAGGRSAAGGGRSPGRRPRVPRGDRPSTGLRCGRAPRGAPRRARAASRTGRRGAP